MARLCSPSPSKLHDIKVVTVLERSDERRRINHFVRERKIGQGRHAQIVLCKDTDVEGREVAMKIAPRVTQEDKTRLLRRKPSPTTEQYIRKEIEILKRCSHMNVVRLFEVIDDPHQDHMYLALELVAGGAVQWQKVVDERLEPLLTLEQARRIIRDVIVGLEYLHCHGIIHRDIKPANLLWSTDRNVVKICDFSISHVCPPKPLLVNFLRRKSQPPRSDLDVVCGTPPFTAPEVVWYDDLPPLDSDHSSGATLTGDDADNALSTPHQSTVRPTITKAIDIWSLGITFFCFLFGDLPFTAPAQPMLYQVICKCDWRAGETMGVEHVPTGGRRPSDPNSEGFKVLNLLDWMLQKHPKDRITIKDLKKHPWIVNGISDPRQWARLTSTWAAPSGCVTRFCRRFAKFPLPGPSSSEL